MKTKQQTAEMQEQNRRQLIFAVGLVLVAIASRVIFNKLEIFNFSMVMSAALFGGAFLTNRVLNVHSFAFQRFENKSRRLIISQAAGKRAASTKSRASHQRRRRQPDRFSGIRS